MTRVEQTYRCTNPTPILTTMGSIGDKQAKVGGFLSYLKNNTP